ncbi:DUF6777 domain-containing protein [Streptomyces sp. NPDC057445]|uniref:DUF6777 domain-containing protein n=1 Tax=Streptomyces sp. NPDC057445 TaxID=3346136 RepID=UPI00368BBA8D
MPKIAAITALTVVVIALAVVLTRPGGGPAGAEVFLQAADTTGPDPFTESSATGTADAPPAALPTSAATPAPTGNAVRGVDGATPGLYGGTQKSASCDIEKQIGFLTSAPEKNRAFASVLGIEPSAVPGHLRSLTALRLRLDTRVTNHGFKDGAATSYQAILQAGTAVLVDDRGVPRVRCACGNPLTPPVRVQRAVERKGEPWAGFEQSRVVVVVPAPRPVDVFVVYDPGNDEYFARDRGDTGVHDKPVPPPRDPLTPTQVPAEPTTDKPAGLEESQRTETCASGDAAATCPPSSPSSGGTSPGEQSPESPATPPAPSHTPPEGSTTAGTTVEPPPDGSVSPDGTPPQEQQPPPQSPAPESRSLPGTAAASRTQSLESPPATREMPPVAAWRPREQE